MRYLVTGCAGFIGSHVCEALLAQGRQVIGVDAFLPTYGRAFKEQNVASTRQHPQFELVEADLTEMDCGGLLHGVDVVFHLAGEPGVRQSWGQGFAAYVRNNVLATGRLLDACRQQPVRRFVLAGSSSVYGDAPDMPWREGTLPQPRSPYAITKLAAEHLCQAYHANFGVPTVILRYFTVYGPRQRPDMAFHRFLRMIMEGAAIPVFGDGTQTRDFTFVSDIVAATLAAAEAPAVTGSVFNVGGGSRVTLNDVWAVLGEITGRPVRLEQSPIQAGDAAHTWADISQAAQMLGYQPRIALAEGLAREYDWLKRTLAGGVT